MARKCKRLVLKRSFESDLNRTTEVLHDVLASCGPPRDWTVSQIRRVLVEFIAALPVYRTYVAGNDIASAADAEFIRQAVQIASQRKNVERELLEQLANVFLALPAPATNTGIAAADRAALRRRFITQFQQMTGAVMAKGCEDTAFYRYLRLTALVRISTAALAMLVLTLLFAERSRWRSRSVWHIARGVPQVQRQSRYALALSAVLHLHARHQARL